MPQKHRRRSGKVPLARALSKLGLLSRSEALAAIRAGRVHVDGRAAGDPAALVVPERVRVSIDDVPHDRPAPRTLLFCKPRGVVTTRRDPQGRTTVFDALEASGVDTRGLVAVGRLDLATSGLLLLTTDTRLADWITDPSHGVPRIYAVTVRGRVTDDDRLQLMRGPLRPHDVVIRKASGRETHLVVELRQGRNREVRRLFASIDREVTRLVRVRLGGLELGSLEPGQWREASRPEIQRAFPEFRMRNSS
jgi:pseudouridine synthase